jgi:SAM-dependent methyltransferase
MWFDHLLSETPKRRDGNNLIFSAEGSAEWSERQQDSVNRYVDESYEEDPTVGQMFGNFIATGLRSRDEVVLDIGCGLFAEPPHYVAQLGLSRFIGLEPLTTQVDRSYPCLCGAIAEQIPLKDDSVDAVLFGTSLDHIEAEDQAINEVKRVLKPSGRIFFWQGLYDPEMLARQKTFEPIFVHPKGIRKLARIAAAPLEYFRIAYRMAKRRKQLESNADIDGVHFRYYTRVRLNESLGRWALTKTRELLPPGQASIFIEAKAE